MKSRYKRSRGYSYGSMITSQDDVTVSELTENVCEFYDYVWKFYPDGRLVISDTILYNGDTESCNWIGSNNCGHLEYCSLNEMLLDWLDELKRNENEEQFTEEIAFIEAMKCGFETLYGGTQWLVTPVSAVEKHQKKF